MSSESLPVGWEARYDPNLGKTYYINHIDKYTTWDHPNKNKKSGTPKRHNGTSKHLGVEQIPLQGSPDLRRNYVYPCQPSPIPAFQVLPHQSPKINLFQDLNGRTRGSPSSLRAKETSLISTTEVVDEAVSKISAMFPTVSEPHIRLLMKNCRYMKSIFPEAEETIILDVLANNDNNIQKTSEQLRVLGFEKKDTFKISQQKIQQQQLEKIKAEKDAKLKQAAAVEIPRVKSAEEKMKIKSTLQEEHENVPEQLISMALESVDFDKEKASDLLKSSMMEENVGKIVEKSEVENEGGVEELSTLPVSQSRQSIKSLLKCEKNIKQESTIFTRVIEESNRNSRYLSNTNGPNRSLAKGNNEKLLLEDYVKWQGPNPILRKGSMKSLAKGPNLSYRSDKNYLARGPNSSYCKGPNRNLVKGSIFQQMQELTVGGESRGK